MVKGLDLHPQSLWENGSNSMPLRWRGWLPSEGFHVLFHMLVAFGGDSRLTLTQCRLVFWDSEHMCFGGGLMGLASRGIFKVPTKADEACLHSPNKFPEADKTSKRSMCGSFMCGWTDYRNAGHEYVRLPIAPSPKKKIFLDSHSKANI